MTDDVILMIFLAGNFIIMFLNILIIKNTVNFWKDCMESIKEYHDSNYEIAKSITNCTTNLLDFMGYKKVDKNDTRTTK